MPDATATAADQNHIARQAMMRSGVLPRLRSSLPHLTPALRRIAAYALDDPEKVIFQTVTELAAGSTSSEGSVIRFCQELGFGGLQDFKLALAVDLASPALPNGLLPAPADTDALKKRALEFMIAGLEETDRLLDAAAVDEAADRILAAKRIDIYGVGASGMTATYLDLKLMRLGLPTKAVVDPHLAAISAVTLDAQSVAIAISSSGSTKDTIQAVDIAHSAGAFVIAVVNRPLSPIAKRADCVLLGSSHESPLAGGAALSKASQMLVLEVLFTAMIARGEGLIERIRATAKGVVEKSL